MEETSGGSMEKEQNVNKNSVSSTTEVCSELVKPGAGDKPREEAVVRFSRLKLFDKVVQKSLDKFIEHASFKGFSSMFRPLYKKNPQRMESIHKQFKEELQKSIQEDINRLIEEGMLEFKLNELDKLESAAKASPEPAWRPSGVPEQDFCSFLMPYYQKQDAYMKFELKKIRAENAGLAEKVRAGRERVADLEHRISRAVTEWKESVTEFEQMAAALCPADVFDD